MDTNVRAMFQLIRGLHGALAACRGSIVNVSSVHAVATSANVAAYAVSKGTVAALTRTAAIQLAAAGVRCNSVLPGAVMTPMLEAGLSRRPHPQGVDGNLDVLVGRTRSASSPPPSRSPHRSCSSPTTGSSSTPPDRH